MTPAADAVLPSRVLTQELVMGTHLGGNPLGEEGVQATFCMVLGVGGSCA